MLSPILFVGVGGSGGNTVRAIRSTLLRRLHAIGWEGDIPEAFQTLWIDTISTQGKGGFNAPILPAEQYLGLVANGVSYTSVKNALISNIPDNHRLAALGGWMPKESAIPIAKGAGQFRAIGRTIGIQRLDAIRIFIRDAMARMTSQTAQKELALLSQKMNLSIGKSSTPSAFVISSMAGGSGSGIFQDVAHAIKLIDPALDDFTHVMLFGADVFQLSVPEQMMKSVPANTLASISETMNGLWRDGVSEGTQLIFDNAGFNRTEKPRFGGKHNWLIGAKNNDVALGSSTDDIYWAVGSSLAALASSPATLEWLNNYVLTNVFAGSASNISDSTNLKTIGNQNHYQPFASMGFSRITLGMDRFREYSAEAITKAAVEKLLWPHLEPVDPANVTTPESKIEVRANQLWAEFLTNSGLKERNPNNDLIESLSPEDGKARYAEFARNAAKQASGGVTGDNGLTSEQWQQRFWSFFQSNIKNMLADESAARNKTAQRWTEDIQDKILENVASMISTAGLEVATTLISKLISEVDFVSDVELPADAEATRRRIDEIQGRITQKLSTGQSKIPANSPAIGDAQKIIEKGAEFLADADKCDLAASLLKDLKVNFLIPLEYSLGESFQQLKVSAREKKSADGKDNLFSEFPVLGSNIVPNRFIPPTTEQSLISHEKFPENLETWAKQSVPDEISNSWKSRLVERAIKGTDFGIKGDDQSQTLIRLEPRWVPQDPDVRSRVGNAEKALPLIFATVEDYLERSLELVTDKANYLSDNINQGLRPYIENPNSSIRADRRSAYESALAAAIKYCAPMVDVNPAVSNIVHPNSSSGSRYISFTQIPLQGTPMENSTKNLVSTFDPGNNHINKAEAFSTSDTLNVIEFYSVIQNAQSPIVFDSLMRPIAGDWNKKRMNPSERAGFWTFRRTKPLTEFMPIAEDKIQQMVIGWFALAFLGLRKIESKDTNLGPKVSVWNEEKKEFFDFPYPLLALPDQYQDSDIFQSVLKSLAIALVDVNTTASLNPIYPYQALINSGSLHKDLGFKKLIENWIVDGKTSVQSITDNSTPEDRRTKLLSEIEKTTKYFSEFFARIDKNNDPFELPKVWGVKNEVTSALSTLHETVLNASTSTEENLIQ
jgi:hypothetical protein